MESDGFRRKSVELAFGFKCPECHQFVYENTWNPEQKVLVLHSHYSIRIVGIFTRLLSRTGEGYSIRSHASY